MPLVLGPLLLGFGVVAGFIVLYGLSQTSQTLTGSSSAREQGGIVGWLKTVTGLSIGGQVLGLANKAIRTTVSHWADAHLRPMTAWLYSLGTLVHHTYRQLGDFATAVVHRIDHALGVEVPHAAKRAAAPARAQAKAAHRSASQAAALARAQAQRLAHLRARTAADSRTLHHAIAVELPQEIAKVNRRAKTAEHEITHPSQDLLHRWAKWLWAAGIAGLVVRTLARRFPWLFCRNAKTLGNLACRLDESLLSKILQDALAIAGTVSLLEFITDAQAVETAALDALSLFIREMPKA